MLKKAFFAAIVSSLAAFYVYAGPFHGGTSGKGFPPGWTGVPIAEVAEAKPFMSSIEALGGKSDNQIISGKAKDVFPALEAYKAYLVKRGSDSSIKTWVMLPDVSLYKKRNTFILRNKEMRAWFDGLHEEVRRNLTLYFSWNMTFTWFYSKVEDFENKEMLLNVINHCIFNDSLMEDVAKRLSLTPEQVEKYRETVFAVTRGVGDSNQDYQAYFLSKLTRLTSDKEAVDWLQTELTSMMYNVDFDDKEQTTWINKLRLLLKTRLDVATAKGSLLDNK